MRLALSAAALAWLAASSAQAQLLVVHRVPAAVAHEAVGAAVESCKAQGYNTSAAFVDSSGALQASLRGDGAGPQTAESAYRKARTSALFGQNSGVFLDAKAAGKTISPLLDRLDDLIVAKGGVVIKVGDEVVGAIAVGGAPAGQIDEACASAALAVIQPKLK